MSQRHAMTHRTNNHHLARSSGNRPVTATYPKYATAPPQEALRDRGECDGIPVTHFWQVERRRLRELERIARMAQRI